MTEVKQRAVDEAAELDARVQKLVVFIHNKEAFKALDRRTRRYLRKQAKFMTKYLKYLNLRLQSWKD